MGYLCANFSLPRPLGSIVMPNVRDRRQTKASLNTPCPHVLGAGAQQIKVCLGGGLHSPSDSNLSMVSPVVASRPLSSASWWSTVCTAALCRTGFRHEAASICVGAAASSTAGRQSCSAAIDACIGGRYKHHKRHKTACYFPSKRGQLFALVTQKVS